MDQDQLESVYQKCRDLAKDLNIQVVTVKQAYNPYPRTPPPDAEFVFIDYITLLR